MPLHSRSERQPFLYFYRMLASERRAHAVQIARASAALVRAGTDVTLTIRRDGRAARGVEERPRNAPCVPLDEAAAEGVRIVPIHWRIRTRWPLEWALARARLASGGTDDAARRPVVFVREIAPYSVIL